MDTDQSLSGRVLRLHFQCRAELPIGSILRVTGSSLWSPTHLTHEDPTQGQSIASQTAAQTPFASSGDEDWVDVSILNQSHATMYTSSIEMYTTPETYPLWQTRRPVVILLNKARGIHHHYYRYLVVTPGATHEDNGAARPTTTESSATMEEDDVSDTESVKAEVATTSNEYSDSSQVMLWEDPFSLFSGSNLCNLPYRTLDIDTLANEVLDVGRIDIWNGKEDTSFQAYSIREAVSITLHLCYYFMF
jgi:hypothetical protein